ncbi:MULTISPECIES: RHS repeat domain-containing protein [Niastella]|uniref:LamG-like jellyroll fold domain-containing protein n=1 Tax=Niastella soli TaxID=2821487 RepID=A0ABS3Z1F7_9BACT|nr:LamG-like jellyroll fold domain-containing protein [Niastella soli]MBO9204000.1 hypothetical protein [Niastella soli]
MKRLLVLVILVCFPVSMLLAASESYIKILSGKLKQGDVCEVIDDKFRDLSLADWNNIQHLSVDNILSFELLFDTPEYFQDRTFTCTLNVSIKYFTSRDQVVPDEINNVDLVVKYQKGNNAVYPATAYYKFKNAFKVTVTVNSITSPEWGSALPGVFRLKNQILVERKYPFRGSVTGPLTTNLQNSNGNSNQLSVSWNTTQWGDPEEYDVEWTFIDAQSDNGKEIVNTYGSGQTLPESKATEWMVNNSSRVTVTTPTYTINLPYPNGYILVRVRGASYQAGTNLRLLGDWSYSSGPGGMAVCEPVTAHEASMNYQYTAAFAEEGKRKEVITYYDATLRNRQAVTLNNSDLTLIPNSTADERQETAVVAESIYDEMGRSAVSVLPAPTNSKSLNYYEKFNVNNSGEPFSHKDIKLRDNCNIDEPGMDPNFGASKYFSANNPFKADDHFYFTKYVPDAQEHPYALTEYMPDNTGLVRRQGGVGNGFTIGSGKATQYFYGKPLQKELDRLFGSEAGDFSHYLKNMVIDPNGQISVSYIDANGRTVATALAGGSPDKLDELPSAAAAKTGSEASIPFNEDLIAPNDLKRDASALSMSSSATFMASTKGIFTVHYSVNPAALTTTHSQGQFCSNCYYEVLVEARNSCGAPYGSTTSAPFTLNDVACNPNAAPYTGKLDIRVDELGSYNVTYTLRLSEQAINYQTQYYLDHNSDLKKLQAFFEEKLKEIDLAGCYSSCESCKTLGNTPAAFRQKVLDLLATDKFTGIQASSEINTWIDNTWNDLKAKCNSLSCNSLTNATSACEDYLARMKTDVVPGGQYALINYDETQGIYSYKERGINVLRFYNDGSNQDICNTNYVDANGNTVNIRDLSESDFIKAYIDHPEWADKFVKKHVEYCSYVFCKDQNYSPVSNNNEASYNFDKTLRDMVNTGDEAVSRGFYTRSNMNALLNVDPFFNGGRGSSMKTSMSNDLINLSKVIGFNVSGKPVKDIFQFVDWMLYCKPVTNTNDPDIFMNTWSSCAVDPTCRSTSMEWELYRNYYLQLKSKYVRQVKSTSDQSCKNCFIGNEAATVACNTPPLTCPSPAEFTAERRNYRDFWDDIYVDMLYYYQDFYIVHPGGPVNRDVTLKVRRNYGPETNFAYDYIWVTIPAGKSEVMAGFEVTCTSARITCHSNSFTYMEELTCPDVPVPIESSCPNDPLHAAYQEKSRIFNEYVNLEGIINCLNSGTNPLPSDAQNIDRYRAEVLSSIDEEKALWINQLTAVRNEEPAFSSVSPNTILLLAEDLKQVAITNVQNATTPETIRIASSIANGGATAKGFHNFAEVFSYYISSSVIQQGFSADLLERPYPHDKTPIDVNPSSGQITSDICANLSLLKSRYSASGFGGSFYEYLKQELEDDMQLTSDQLLDLEAKCAAGCRYMKDPVLFPVALTTPVSANSDHPFINCSRMAGLQSQFNAAYPGVNVNSKLYYLLFTNFCNHKLGYSLGYTEYEAFSQKCGSNSTAVLYNKPAQSAIPVDEFACERNAIMGAYESAGQVYEMYIAVERQRFRNRYISKCLATQANASIEGKQYEYHFTLYYYDQSGNLVKTIPPEGVRLLTEEQLAQLKYMRATGYALCGNDGITKETDKNIVLNTLSSNFTTAKSLELWLNNMDAIAGGQVRFITPDHKYMYQAAIANKKLWVELYTLQPGTAGDIAITQSNQLVADISSFTIQEWSHVVIQSNNLTSDPWDAYLNGVKLTMNTGANMPGYPFDWSITAGYTLPDEVMGPVKHVRLYSQLLGSTQITENYSNLCFSIASSLQGQGSPLLIWGNFDNGIHSQPITETASVSNPGALQVNANLNMEQSYLPSVVNTFTVEFWVNPQGTHEIDAEDIVGTQGCIDQKYAIYPSYGGSSSSGNACMGVSVGTNGVSVYEHADGYMPPLLAWAGTVKGWTHVAVVYNNKVPSLYINGRFVKTGLTSTKQTISPSYNFVGGGWGYMPGGIDEVRIWNMARTEQQIMDNYVKGIADPASATALAGYWPMDPENGSVLADLSSSNHNVALPGSGYSWITEGGNTAKVEGAVAAGSFIVPQHGMATTYMHNSLNQVVKQVSPDGGTARFWYDRLGKLTASQNAEQLQPLAPGASSNRYSYTKYDAFDRIVELGEKTNTGVEINETVARNNATLQNWMQSGQNGQITQTIYDEAPSYAPGLLTNLRKRVAASIVLSGAIGSQRTAATYYSYDISGNAKTLYQENSKLLEFDALTGLKRIDYDYDLISGKVNKVKYQEGKGDQFYYRYRYDADNRVVDATTSRDGLIWNTEARYRYYLHGPLARTELGNIQVQGLDYAYTLQGWMKGINSQQLDASKDMNQDGLAGTTFQYVARDVMGFSLGYYNGDYQPIESGAPAFGMSYQPLGTAVSGTDLFNGNISNATLAINKFDNGAVKGYSYRYDQVDRLKQMRMHNLAAGGSNWNINSGVMQDYQEDITYDGNGNIFTYKRNGNIAGNYPMDDLTYRYNLNSDGKLVNNKLRSVKDDALDGAYGTDIKTQPNLDNYRYDQIGNLIKDEKEGIDPISWTVYGKISQLTKNGQNIQYAYDAAGNRISKLVTGSGNNILYTFYVRDPQGNVLGVYTRNASLIPSPDDKTKWTEQHLYGSSRLGIWQPNMEVATTWQPPGEGNGQLNLGERAYELCNHLGNVLATISDDKTGIDDDNNKMVDYYTANVLTASDYYPFGMRMPGRIFNSGNYRYGFNGKENDNEAKGEGNQLDYGMRIYDPRIGRFLSVDPLTRSYPWYTPYQFAGNKPIWAIDLDGLEELTTQQLEQAKRENNARLETIKSNARLYGISLRGSSDAIYNANTLGISDWTGATDNLEEYSDVEEQKAYLTGKIAGNIIVGIQSTIEVGGGLTASKYGLRTAAVTGVESGGSGVLVGGGIALGGLIVAGHGALVGKIGATGLADAIKDLYKVNANSTSNASGQQAKSANNGTTPSTGTGAKGTYKDVGGHHVHAKAGFKDNLSYDKNVGFSISQDYMKSRNWDHQLMTNKQRELFKELANSGRANTLKEHSRIAIEALKAGGATDMEARKLVNESLKNLQSQGVTYPTNIPWHY